MADSTEWEAVKPGGLAAAILGVTIAFSVLCIVVVGLRVGARVSTGVFGLEDWLMCVGFALNMVHNGIVIWGTFTGIGTYDSKLNTAMMIEGAKSIVFWQIFYISGSVFIKASICATLARIATQRRYIYTLWGLVAVSVIATLVAISAVLVRCKPVAASWNPALGTCIDQSIIIALTYAVSVINIVTDWAVAVIPVFILWNLQMRKTLKKMIALVLGLGVLASIATIIRMPYSSVYSHTTDLLHDIGNIILWTVVECDLGIIAGSMPMLRTYIRMFAKDESSYQGGSGDLNLVTIGRIKGKHNPIHDAEFMVTAVGGNDRESDKDDESTKQMIKVTRRIDQVSSRGYEQV
ncbi:hypothetical protein BGZ61DRAFT_594821 [Ilyonectria robusta]|uniref:uncharacterized protein n=1 Tax=Ilyonectria robusta TaxID=1079257 RepID=UPI001E8CAE78|nr:uncharacterized protein BGZ61DRAFT_594821 [Ilyonectria robusta]KAH8654192.1 hypothetical protein BGZ61DRAFT_594821 [Ilyonectria robusta]